VRCAVCGGEMVRAGERTDRDLDRAYVWACPGRECAARSVTTLYPAVPPGSPRPAVPSGPATAAVPPGVLQPFGCETPSEPQLAKSEDGDWKWCPECGRAEDDCRCGDCE
jgi:hypothetical protein